MRETGPRQGEPILKGARVSKIFEIIGAPYDLGSPARGCARGPAALRGRGLVRWLQSLEWEDLEILDGGDAPPQEVFDPDARPKNVRELRVFGEGLLERLDRSYEKGRSPVVIGGDHSISVATVAAAAKHVQTVDGHDAALGLLWVDAHPDLETPDESPGGDMHGTPVAHLLGYGEEDLRDLGGFSPKIRPENVAFIGLREIMACERKRILDLNMAAYTPSDVERSGIEKVCEEAFERVMDGTSGYVLSFDLDACNPAEVPGVYYPEPGGLTFREAHLLMEYAAKTGAMTSLEVVEYFPEKDRDWITAVSAGLLVRAALGGPVL
ncbi:MAG: arginase [Planctomycetota bacterium]|jgi:arginase